VASLDLAVLCGKCTGVCCKQNDHDFAVLLEEDESEYESIVVEDGFVGEVRVIPYRNGQCIYLGVDDRCTIYERRPRACVAFDCTSNYPERISYFLEDNPVVLQLIQLELSKLKGA